MHVALNGSPTGNSKGPDHPNGPAWLGVTCETLHMQTNSLDWRTTNIIVSEGSPPAKNPAHAREIGIPLRSQIPLLPE